MTVRDAGCTHKTVGRVGDHDTPADAPRVYLFCWDCSRILGVYDPTKAGRLQLARVA